MVGRRDLFTRWRRFQPDWIRIILGLNLAIFLLSLIVTHHLSGGYGAFEFSPSSPALFLLGSSSPAAVLKGEVLRLLTATMLHVSLLHIGMNMLALWQIGPMVRHLIGAHSFVSLYVLSGLVGAIASVGRFVVPVLDAGSLEGTLRQLNHLPGGVGASGALFGVFGCLFLIARKTPGAQHVARQLTFWLIINLVIGFQFPQIDNAAHIGGFVCGLLFAKVWLRGERIGLGRFLLGPKPALVCFTLYCLAILSIGWLWFGPMGQTRRAYLKVSFAVFADYQDDLNQRDLKDILEEVETLDIPRDRIDLGALESWLKVRIDSDDRGHVTGRNALYIAEKRKRWREFVLDYMDALGPVAGLRSH